MNSNEYKYPCGTLEETLKFAKLLAVADFIPPDYRGKVENVFYIICKGHEIGFQPIQSIEGIDILKRMNKITNQAIYTLAISARLKLAKAQSSPEFEDYREYMESPEIAVCIVKRKNRTAYMAKYSKEMAIKAGLWGKGVWQAHEQWMLLVRARSRALDATFGDHWTGFYTTEEAEDIPEIEHEKSPAEVHKEPQEHSKETTEHGVEEEIKPTTPAEGQLEIPELNYTLDNEILSAEDAFVVIMRYVTDIVDNETYQICKNFMITHKDEMSKFKAHNSQLGEAVSKEFASLKDKYENKKIEGII